MDIFPPFPAVTLAMGQMAVSKPESTDLCLTELNYSNTSMDFMEKEKGQKRAVFLILRCIVLIQIISLQLFLYLFNFKQSIFFTKGLQYSRKGLTSLIHTVFETASMELIEAW